MNLQLSAHRVMERCDDMAMALLPDRRSEPGLSLSGRNQHAISSGEQRGHETIVGPDLLD